MATPDRPTFVYEPNSDAGSFVMLMAKEMHPTVDGRMFAEGSIDWRELPIPLTLQRVNNKDGQHKDAIAVGPITEIWKDGTDVFGRGYFSSDSEGQIARELIREGTISGVSADVGGVTSEELSAGVEYPEGVNKVITKGTIIGVTALLHASFNETKIAVDEAPITAAGGEPWTPDPKYFQNPNLEELTPLTITADGHIFGHAAAWGTCHVGYRDRCVTPPRSASNYAFFNTGTVLTADGNAVHVGRITADTGHAPLEFSAQPAKAHYDDTGFAAAFVAAGEDQFGIWYSGVISPNATETQIANIRAAGVSGDWRSIQSSLEMIGLLAVNTPGFPIPRPKVGMVAGAQVSLIAAGYIEDYVEGKKDDSDEETEEKEEPCCEGCKDGHGCDDEKEESLAVVEEDCGCEETIAFDYDNPPVDWSSDLDRTFIASIREHYVQIVELANQASNGGTALSWPVQSYALGVKSDAQEQVNYADRSLGTTVHDPEEEVNTVPDSAYAMLEVEILDLDMAVLA